MHERTRRLIVSANTGRITSYVHNIEQWNRSDRLRQFTNSNQVRAESGEWIGPTQAAQSIHHCQDRQSHTSSRQSGRVHRITRAFLEKLKQIS